MHVVVDVGDAVDVQATDSIQEEKEGSCEVTPEHQGEAHECDLAPEKVKKLRRPMKERANKTSKREGRSLHTWDTMRSPRKKTMTTTAKVATLQATSISEASLGTWA